MSESWFQPNFGPHSNQGFNPNLTPLQPHFDPILTPFQHQRNLHDDCARFLLGSMLMQNGTGVIIVPCSLGGQCWYKTEPAWSLSRVPWGSILMQNGTSAIIARVPLGVNVDIKQNWHDHRTRLPWRSILVQNRTCAIIAPGSKNPKLAAFRENLVWWLCQVPKFPNLVFFAHLKHKIFTLFPYCFLFWVSCASHFLDFSKFSLFFLIVFYFRSVVLLIFFIPVTLFCCWEG